MNQEYFNFLFLTGDVVAHPTQSNWHTVIHELSALKTYWYIAPGNHDFGTEVYLPFKRDYELDENRKSYNFFSFRNNIFLVLNTSFDGWTINQQQNEELSTFLSLNVSNQTQNIFVFSHQLWWQKEDSLSLELDSIRTNSYALFEGESNFWKDAYYPIFSKYETPKWFFAGDVGSAYILEAYYEDHSENSHFYASGMGGGKDDNYLVVKVSKQGEVNIEKRNF